MPNYGQIPDCYDMMPWHRDVLTVAHRKLVAIAPDYYVEDIKEKYGALRLYVSAPELEDVEWEDLPKAGELREKLEHVTEATEAVANNAYLYWADEGRQRRHDLLVAEVRAELENQPS